MIIVYFFFILVKLDHRPAITIRFPETCSHSWNLRQPFKKRLNVDIWLDAIQNALYLKEEVDF